MMKICYLLKSVMFMSPQEILYIFMIQIYLIEKKGLDVIYLFFFLFYFGT